MTYYSRLGTFDDSAVPYEFSPWPAHTFPKGHAIFTLARALRSRVMVGPMTQREFAAFEDQLAQQGWTLREIERHDDEHHRVAKVPGCCAAAEGRDDPQEGGEDS